jgi:hydroxyacylglutathione hydrolase
MTLTLLPLPAFTDNYIWILHNGTQAVVVDPGQATPVQQFLQSQGLELEAILITHHHGDHTGGVDELLEHAGKPIPVWGPAQENILQVNRPIKPGEVVQAMGLSWKTMGVPGHTLGHLAYWVDAPELESPLLFCGDTLFSGGCGRLFEGTPAQMLHSLQQLAWLPPHTRVCCAHEYTVSNLHFATAAEPDNPVRDTYLQHCLSLRQLGMPTLPSTLALEANINPFMRCSNPALVRSVQALGCEGSDALSVFTFLRQWKNEFKLPTQAA